MQWVMLFTVVAVGVASGQPSHMWEDLLAQTSIAPSRPARTFISSLRSDWFPFSVEAWAAGPYSDPRENSTPRVAKAVR
jgi:hypothetical protein